MNKTKASLLIGILLSAITTNAATLRVEKVPATGIYTNINDAIKAAPIGGTISIGPGTYEEQVVIAKNITIMGDGPQYVTLSPSAGQGDAIVVRDASSPTIRGLFITAKAGSGVVVGNQAVAGGPATTTIANCVIYGCANYGVVHNSYFSGMNGLGARIFVDHCTIIRCVRHAIYSWNWDNSGRLDVRSSIIANNAAGVEFDRSISRSTSLYQVLFTMIVGKQNGESPTIGNTDPLFINENQLNLALQEQSQAVNAGPVGETDPDGSPSDLGAFGGPDSAPFWPYRPGGPVIRSISVNPPSVSQGGTITIKATATTR